MVVANGPIRSFVAGDEPYADKAIDVEAYKNALKESGYTHEEAQRYWNDPSNADPYASLGKEIAAAVKYQVPKVSVSNGEVRIDAPKSTWDSPVVNQLKNELQVLKGVDLSNPEVTNAVNALNKELQQNWQNSMIEQTTGWTPEEYKNYQHAVQVVSRPNPLATSDYITGKKLDGKIVKMTVQDWLNYWKENLTVDQRTDAFIKSYNSNDPYERIMALIMGQGKDRPVYGFDTGERIGQFFAATGNELAKLPIGIMRLFGTDNNTKRAESIARKSSVPFSAMAKIKAVNEDVFNNKKKELDGKSWSQLNDDDKAFLILLGTSKENSSLNTAEREIMSGTKTSAGYRAEDLDRMSSEDDDISREAIRDILVENSFDNYKKAQDNFTTWYNYDEDTSQLSKRLEQNAIWSGNEQFAGSMAGTVGRYLWEAALVRAATGGISPKSITNPKLVKGTAGGVNVNAISDKIAGSWNPATKTGSGILGALGKNGISPASNFGRNVMDFTARLVGTIPEDILQTSIDNTLTYHPEDNRFYDRLDEVPENLVSNFLMMAAANAVGAGLSTVKRARLAKEIEKAKVLTTKLDIPELMTADIDDFARAAAKNEVKIDGDKVTVKDADGNERVLKNVDGEMAEAGLKKLGVEAEDVPPYKFDGGTGFYKFVEANSPIDGVREKGGSITAWLGDLSDSEEVTRAKFEQLPREMKVAIENEPNYRYLKDSGRYDDTTVFARLNTDFPISARQIDGTYSNYLWNSMKQGQPSVAANATAEPTATEANVQASIKDINEDVKAKQPWSDIAGDTNERIKAEREYIKQNSPVNVDTDSTEGSVGEWLKDSKTRYSESGNITTSGNDDFMNKWNQLPSEVRDAILNDNDFKTLWETYEPEEVAARMGTEYPQLSEKVDDIYAEYLWRNRDKIKAENVRIHNEQTAKKRLGDMLNKVTERVNSNDVSYDAVLDLWKAKNAIQQASVYDNLGQDITALRLKAGELWKNIHDAGLEVQDLTGRAYNEGMNVDVLRIDGDPNGKLYVIKTTEPAILEDGKIVRKAAVVLGNEPPSAEQLDVFDKTPTSGYEHKLMIDESGNGAPGGYESTADYYRKAKNKAAEFVYMTPDEYLEALTEKNGGPYQDVAKILERSDPEEIAKYAERMTNRDFNPGAGDGKFPTLFLGYDENGHIEQEGIHRAFAAKQAGIDKVPVTVVYPYKGRPDIVDRILDGKEKVPDVEAPKAPDAEAPNPEMETPDIESDAVRNWREQIAEAEDRLREVAPQKSASDISKMSYERRKALAQAVADKSDGEYVVLYRVQEGNPDDFRPNRTGKNGEFKALGDEAELEGAVWLTSDPEWAEGANRATAGIGKDVSPEDVSIVAIPVKKSLIDNIIYDGGDTAGKGYRNKLKEKGKKIVQTRGIETDDALKQKQLYYDVYGNDFTGLDSTDPKLWPQSEFILWKQDAQDVFDDGMELMLKEHNKQVDNTAYKRQARRIEGEIDEANTALKAQLDEEATVKAAEPEVPKAETPEVEKIQVETETPKGTVMEEVDDYRFKNHADALETEVKPTKANLQRWHARALEAADKGFDDMMTRFHDKFGDVTVDDFDWVRHQVQQDIPESEILGSTDPHTGRVIDQNKLDAMRWYAEQPEVKDLRKASLNALTNQDSDYNILGYLPHTDYDPSNLDYDEALAGVLWKKSTGASVMKDGEYVGYGGTFKDRYHTFASNMLWDAKSPDIATSKLVEEAMLDGNDFTPELVEQAKKVTKGDIKILGIVDKSASTKDIIKNLSSDASEKADFDKIQENTRKDAEKSGLSKAIHDNWTIYRGHNTKNVASQPKAFATLRFSFDSLCNNLRKIVVDGLGTLYDNGAADMINANGNAYELTMRYARGGGSLKDMLVDYIVNHSHRSAEAASEIADKWITRIGDIDGDKTIGNVSIELAKCMYNEGQSRVRRFLSLAKYDQFNSATRNAIDQFLFSKMQTNAIKNSPMITKAVTKALNVATHMRYQALFYGNVKNALLQISELSRLSTTFKWGDIATMAKKMATDADFRERVDIYVDAIAPQTSRLNAELYQKYANVADGMEVKSDGVKFKDITNKMDDIGLAPINAAEAYKNRMMIAALVQEADSKGYTGDAAMRYIRQRFERVALAADEMGKIGITSNPIARVALFLQNFQIRELGMHYYNLLDEAALAKTLPGKLARQVKYLSKVLGSKLAVTLILARLGYSASQTIGFDPFGLMDNYQKLDEDEMNELDKQISNGFLTPLFSGGMTSMIADLYFMSRKAYEDSVRETVSDEAQQNLDKPGFFDSLRFWERTKVPDDALSFSKLMEGAQQFIPGSTAAKRIQQMNEMMDTGWATSATGNKMYTAPDDMLNTILGYLFGRSATQNAQQYNQTYGDNLWQTLGRFMPGRSWGDFDPIDSENYSDWFKGDENDAQQFNKGIYYFRDRKDEIIDAYEDAMRKSYSSSDDSEAKNDMNQRLDELFNQLEKFVSAYERKHGTITPAMTKQVLNILNTYRKNVGDTADEAAERSLEGYNKALERYSALDMPAVGTYSGPTEGDATKEVKYQGSPQWRAAVNGYYSTSDEALAVLKEADKVLAPIRKQLKDSVSAAYNNKDWNALGRIQKKYLQEFDNVVGPIVASYGNGIFSDTDVVNQLRDMLSTGTNSRSANLIPSEQYAKNKYGKYQSMPYETVDVKKWAQKRYSGDTYTNSTITSNSTAAEDLAEIKKLIRRGQNDLAKARALQLKVRVDNQTRSLSSDDYKWLESYLNYKEGK